LSIPKLGATDFGHRIAAQFGLTLVHPRPGLVPLTFDGAELEFCRGLSGISLEAEVSCGNQHFRENILFTHRGLSGPAILQISSYWNPGLPISVDLSPAVDLGQYLRTRQSSDAGITSVLSEIFPRRFVASWCERNLLSGPMTRHSLKRLSAVAEGLHKWTIRPLGTEGYEKAEVTCGGVNTDELSSRTMESKKVRGLFLIGEVLDVTGHLGGYNFQWAWASGFSAGQYV
jgi:predicted Rossmann fold flavoprotein